MADETLSAIDEDSKAMLEDHVKKGKARKFILITKGATIKSLIVFKKGPYGPKINKAKKEGFRGEATCGVITGKGVNITFKLPGTAEVSSAMKTEGNVYEGEPCKIAKLRAFFKDEADLKFKPEFQVVKQLSDVTTVSERDDETEGNLAEVALGDVETDERKQKLVAALKKMTAVIQQAVVAQPDRKNEILTPAATIKDHLQANRLDEARDTLLNYNEFLREILAAGQSAAVAAPPPPPPPQQVAEAPSPKESEWNWRLKELTPKLKQVLAEQLGDFAQVGATFKEAHATKSHDIEKAVEVLKRCEKMVELALREVEGSWADASAGDYQQAWIDIASEFLAQRARVAQTLPGERLAEFDRLVSHAQNLANQNEFQQALQITVQIAELDTAARKAASVPHGIPENVVAERKTFLLSRWQTELSAAISEIDNFRAALAEEPDEDPDNFCSSVERHIRDFTDELNAAILNAQKATAGQLTPLEQARSLIIDYKQRLSGDKLLNHLSTAKAEVGVDFDIVGRLNKALDEIADRLAMPA